MKLYVFSLIILCFYFISTSKLFYFHSAVIILQVNSAVFSLRFLFLIFNFSSVPQFCCISNKVDYTFWVYRCWDKCTLTLPSVWLLITGAFGGTWGVTAGRERNHWDLRAPIGSLSQLSLSSQTARDEYWSHSAQQRRNRQEKEKMEPPIKLIIPRQLHEAV